MRYTVQENDGLRMGSFQRGDKEDIPCRSNDADRRWRWLSVLFTVIVEKREGKTCSLLPLSDSDTDVVSLFLLLSGLTIPVETTQQVCECESIEHSQNPT